MPEGVNKKDIVKGLKELGLSGGDMLLVHSSLSSIGYVEGGADTVVDAILEVVGEKGTVAVPNLPVIWYPGENHVAYLRKQPIFDVRVTPSRMGRISEVLRRRPEAKRSLHPSHSVAAIGARRDWLIEGHEKCKGPCGEGSPYWKNCLGKGKILFMGVTQASNTTLHTVEEMGGAPMLTEEWFYPLVIDYSGHLITVVTHAHCGYGEKERDFLKMESICEKKGIVKKRRIGNSALQLIEAEGLFYLGLKLLKKDKLFLSKK